LEITNVWLKIQTYRIPKVDRLNSLL
jgi:hypothetical protein